MGSSVHGILRLPLLLLLLPLPAAAQSTDRLPAPAVELTGAFAGFIDEALFQHVIVGRAARLHVSPRISVGPEIQFLVAPGVDLDLILTGNVTFDVEPPGQKATFFLIAGGGIYQNRSHFGRRTFSSTEGTFTAGGGVRSWLNDRVYVAAEARLGGKLHWRFIVTVGVALTRGP